MKNLPDEYLKRMAELLGDEFGEYEKCLNSPPLRGIRINTLKISKERFFELLGSDLNPVAFADDGFYIPSDLGGVGNNPLHHAGAFYIQEPSAMSAVTALSPQRGEKILDLCAAPGGKSTAIAARLCGEGLLWSNEVIKSRTQPLLSNIERMGIRNAVVSSCTTDILCRSLAGFFDRVIVDAPCSGEGMMRREEEAVLNWSIQNVQACAKRQLSILENAKNAVKGGGILTYSTCTFSFEENEKVIGKFLLDNPDFELIEIPKKFGRPAFKKYSPNCKNIEFARRIFPMDGGEGHFVAVMKRSNKYTESIKSYPYPSQKAADPEFSEFYNSHFKNEPFGIPVNINGNIIILPKNMPDFKVLNVLRAGVLAGMMKGKRFEPSHGLYMAHNIGESIQTLNLKLTDRRTKAYLKGEEIDAADLSGYTAVAVEGIITGFGKVSNGKLKNHYPKGLRLLR